MARTPGDGPGSQTLKLVDSLQSDFLSLSSMHLRIQSTVSTIPLFRSKTFLNQKYTIEGLSVRHIAVLIGCGHSSINTALIRYGIAKKKQPTGWLTERGVKSPSGQTRWYHTTVKRIYSRGL